ncbi:MAG: class I SAM-dependent methyltransferase [Lachnospiraceae bacterium]|jgi:SAM-dependent methyltransferase|nr:class I SAM-dependent methyltransferase [Lachnospiraceae bacterium]
MDAYTGFAEVYDMFQDNIPYEEWCDYLVGLLADCGVRDGLVLDLGCGTGRMTRLLSERGFDMTGVDSSQEMLGIAMDRREAGEEGSPILYLCQDMREFELYGTVAAVVSVCDCLNYITDRDGLLEVFRLVNNYLDPGGVFIFDMNTVWKYEELLAEETFAEVRENAGFIWENFYDREERINEYDLTLFIRNERTGEYRRYQETHFQRAYDLLEVKEAAEAAGLSWEAVYDAFTKEPVRPDSERVHVILRECRKAAQGESIT